MPDDVHQVIEAAVRDAYGRLVAYLASRTRDLASAEDAVSGAVLAALETWPRDGVPTRPTAWLLTAARRRLLDDARHDHVRGAATETLRRAAEDAQARLTTNDVADDFPDDRLRLLFACAHPAIDAAVRTPLMLQAVLGLDAARIGRAMLVSPAAMSQRLVRAKAKILAAGIAFDVPEGPHLRDRLRAVGEAIYAAYASGWDDATGTDVGRRGVAEEAMWLARELVRLMPREPEPRGLLALMLYCESRKAARRAADGRYVPLTEQDVALWDAAMIDEAERALAGAAGMGRPGPFQYEAAIQSVHAERRRTGATNWPAVAALYEALVRMAPTLGALVGRAAAVAEAVGPRAALQRLDEIAPDSVAAYQPYWAVRADVLRRTGRPDDAAGAYGRAVGLTADAAVRQFLLARRETVVSG